MLTRKPTKNETLFWKFGNEVEKYIVVNSDDRFVWLSHVETGKSELFIWKHLDGSYNTLLYSQEEINDAI